MMKKNGFTLVELLAVIVVIGIISVIVFPSVNKTLKNQRNKLYDRQVVTIKDAAESWGAVNTSMLPSNSDAAIYVSLSTLTDGGFLKNEEMKDPRTGELMAGCVSIIYDNGHSQYIYEYIDANDSGYANQCS